MTNQLITISAFIIFTLCAPAHAQTQQGALADSTQMIAAEANVTRDAVTQMLQHMAEQSTNIEFHAADYRVKTARFQRRISRALTTFETYLSTSIFPRLSVLANRYNSIYNSTVLSPEQKDQLLRQQQRVFARTDLPQIRSDYWTAIQAVYQVVGNGIRSGFQNRRDRARSYTENEQIFVEVIYPELLRGCRSQICLALSASDLKTYIELVHTRIDRPLTIMLADQSTSLDLYPTTLNTESIQWLLSSVSYPAEAFTLPFDTEAE